MGDLDRRKHDVDIIERVLRGVHDRVSDDEAGRRIDVSMPSRGGASRIVELTVNLSEESPRRRRTD